MAIISVLACAVISIAQQQNSPSGSNIRQLIPYDPPNEQQVKLEITASYSKPLPNSGGKILFKGAKIKQFPRTGGAPEMIAETPECISDNQLNELTSDKPLKVEANNGNIFLEGIGFLLHHKDSTLVISNQVHSILHTRADTNGAGPITEIFSNRGQFEMKPEATNGLALYQFNVRVNDPQMKLTCEWLKADLPKSSPGQTSRVNHIVAETNVVADFITTNHETIHATGENAVYDYVANAGTTNQVIQLTGHPRIDLTNGWMTADVFTLDRTANKLRGNGNYHFHYQAKPATGSNGTNIPPESTIACDQFDYDLNTRLAICTEHVAADDPRMNLVSDYLTATLPKQEPGKTNHFDHVLAETNVAIDLHDEKGGGRAHATGQKAVYDFKISGGKTNETMELSGNPTVQLTNGCWMSADIIFVDRAQETISGAGNHHSVIKKTNDEPASMDTEIFSDRFDFARATGLAVYHDNVRAYDPELNLNNAGMMTVKISEGAKGQSNQIDKIVTEGHVNLDFVEKAFDANDITNLPAFAARLKTPATNDGVAQFVSSRLSPPTRKKLATYQGGTNAPLQQALAADLNRLTQSGPVYETNRFAKIFLSVETTELMHKNIMGLEVIELNRLLLLDAFRSELSRGRTGEITRATGDRAIYTRQGPDPSTTALLELFGHPKLSNPGGTVVADDFISYDRSTGIKKFVGHPRFEAAVQGLAKAPTASKKATK